jgi:hypothetical protein
MWVFPKSSTLNVHGQREEASQGEKVSRQQPPARHLLRLEAVSDAFTAKPSAAAV